MPEEKTEEPKKIKACPMRKWEDEQDNTGFDACLGDRCAWWQEQDECCVLLSLNSNLFGIGMSVCEIPHRLPG